MKKSDLKIHDTDFGVLHGELYLDDKGEASFICHTPAEMGPDESREALIKFMRLLLNKVIDEEWCPVLDTIKDEDLHPCEQVMLRDNRHFGMEFYDWVGRMEGSIGTSRMTSLAKTKIEEAMMWADKAIQS